MFSQGSVATHARSGMNNVWSRGDGVAVYSGATNIQSQVDFNRKKTTNIDQVTLQLQLHFIHIQISP